MDRLFSSLTGARALDVTFLKTQLLVEPINALVLSSSCDVGIILKLQIGANGKTMACSLVDLSFTLGLALLGFHGRLDHGGLLGRDLVIHLGQGKRHGQSNFVNVGRERQHARVSRESCIDQGRLGVRVARQQRNVLASPAETCRSNRETFRTKGFEKRSDARLRRSNAVVPDKGYNAPDHECGVVNLGQDAGSRFKLSAVVQQRQ